MAWEPQGDDQLVQVLLGQLVIDGESGDDRQGDGRYASDEPADGS